MYKIYTPAYAKHKQKKRKVIEPVCAEVKPNEMSIFDRSFSSSFIRMQPKVVVVVELEL